MDSTDRERISVTREELYKMLAHEVSRILGIRCVLGGYFYHISIFSWMLFQIENYLSAEFVILTLSNLEVYLEAVEGL